MGADVYSIERYQELHLQAKETLNKLGHYPRLCCGGGFEGLPQRAPSGNILVTAVPEKPPDQLFNPLRIGGWMLAPIGGRQGQRMTVIKRISNDKFRESEPGDFIFVPMQKGTDE